MDNYLPKFKLKTGDLFPEFGLLNQHGKTVQLQDIVSKWLVIFFYPKDNTPTCTKEACNLRDHFAQLLSHDVHLLGMSSDTVKSHQKFIDKFQLPYDLLVDENNNLAKTLGVYSKKKFMGIVFQGIHRSTFILNSEKKIHEIIYPVVSAKHQEQILESISNPIFLS